MSRADSAPEVERKAGAGEEPLGGNAKGATSTREASATVKNTLKHVRIDRAYFPYENSPPQDVFDTRSRLLTATEVSDALDWFVRPATWSQAVTTLQRTHHLVISGRGGTGKSTAAINLLNELGVERIERIQPAVEISDLDKIEIAKHTGYVVFDHTAVVKPDAGTDYVWESLAARLVEQRSYLVLTRTSPTSFGSPVPWVLPNPQAIIRERLRDDFGTTADNELLEHLPDDWTIGRLVEACTILKSGLDVAAALEVFEVTAQREVEQWLEHNAENHDHILEAVALCFMSGVGEGRFERAVRDLRELVFPAPEDDEQRMPVPQIPAPMAGRRGSRTAGDGIFGTKAGTHQGMTTRVVAFRTPPHWRHAVEGLYTTYGAEVWTPVSNWLPGTLAQARSEDEVWPVARGLFFLCAVDFAETLETYLVPFSRGEAGEHGVECAVAVLLFLAADPDLGAAALQVAQKWADSESLLQRLVAAEALISEVGVRYPDAAARRIWQLLTQDKELGPNVCAAPAFLLASLEETGAEPLPVVQFLHRKVVSGLGPRTSEMTRTTVCEVVCAVFGSERIGPRRGIAARILARDDEASHELAALFAVAQRYVPYRRKLLESLWRGLDAADDPQPAIRSLSRVLVQHLSEEHRHAFLRQLAIVDKQQRARSKGRPSFGGDVMIAFLDALSRSQDEGADHA